MPQYLFIYLRPSIYQAVLPPGPGGGDAATCASDVAEEMERWGCGPCSGVCAWGGGSLVTSAQEAKPAGAMMLRGDQKRSEGGSDPGPLSRALSGPCTLTVWCGNLSLSTEQEGQVEDPGKPYGIGYLRLSFSHPNPKGPDLWLSSKVKNLKV